jgi:hypothetical protein
MTALPAPAHSTSWTTGPSCAGPRTPWGSSRSHAASTSYQQVQNLSAFFVICLDDAPTDEGLLHFISRVFLSTNIKYFVEGIYRKRPAFFICRLFRLHILSTPPPPPASIHRLPATSYTENRKTPHFFV